MAEKIPRNNPKNADDFLEETEVITRILQVLHKFSLDLEKIDWSVIFFNVLIPNRKIWMNKALIH